MKKNHSLIILGSGIKTISHISLEALNYIKDCERILYSVNEPILEQWIQSNHHNSASLDRSVKNETLRSVIYKQISDEILKNLEIYESVGVIYYGHPTVFASSALKAAILAKELGYFTKVIPAISAEDCLFADLLIDPGSHGCQSFETTDFLIHQRSFSMYSHLILWQIGAIGALGSLSMHDNSCGMEILTKHLLNVYPKHHEVFCYEASLYPHIEPKIEKLYLEDLSSKQTSTLSTLYIPPVPSTHIDFRMVELLGMNISDL